MNIRTVLVLLLCPASSKQSMKLSPPSPTSLDSRKYFEKVKDVNSKIHITKLCKCTDFLLKNIITKV